MCARPVETSNEMCTSKDDENSKLPYILTDQTVSSNKKDELPKIHLNRVSSDTVTDNDDDECSAGGSDFPNNTIKPSKSSSFYQLKRHKQIEPRLLMPNNKDDYLSTTKLNGKSYDEPLTAPILTTTTTETTRNERRKPRASIAFDFNILHYLTIGHYFNSNNNNKYKTNNAKATEEERDDLDSYGSVISLIKPTKKKNKKKKSKKSDRKKVKKVLKTDQSFSTSSSSSSLSSLSSSLLSLNNLSSSIEKLSNKFKASSSKKKVAKDKNQDYQMLNKHGRIIVPSEPFSANKSMMQWHPTSRLINHHLPPHNRVLSASSLKNDKPQNQSTKFAFLKNKIFRSQSFDTPSPSASFFNKVSIYI